MVWFHRGQSSKAWDLKPSLLRLFGEVDLIGAAAIEVERDALLEFKRRARLWLRSELLPGLRASAIAWWPIMQHFSCPTRLLDWTRSPWIALYFAVSNHFDEDGVIWSFVPNPLKQKQKDAQQEFAARPFDDNPPHVFVIEATMPTDRLEAQQGIFTVATSPTLVQDGYLTSLRRTIVRASIKQECLFRLKAMNLTAASLFPGLDGLGKEVAESVRVSSWIRSNHNASTLRVVQSVQRDMDMLEDTPLPEPLEARPSGRRRRLRRRTR